MLRFLKRLNSSLQHQKFLPCLLCQETYISSLPKRCNAVKPSRSLTFVLSLFAVIASGNRSAVSQEPVERAERESERIEPIQWVSMDVAKAREAQVSGVQFFPITFSTHRLYREAPDENTPRSDQVTDYRDLIEVIEGENLVPIGVSTTWVFPEFAVPPRIPAMVPPGSYDGFEEVRLACVPDAASEYERLVTVRSEMYAAMARSFPNIDQWMLGYDPELQFYTCSGEPLDLGRLVIFIVDTLETVTPVLRGENANATIIAHFLGRPSIPILVT